MPLTSTFLSNQSLFSGSTAVRKSVSASRASRQRTSAVIQEPPVSKKELRKPRTENVGADQGFYVDHTCIGKQKIAACLGTH